MSGPLSEALKKKNTQDTPSLGVAPAALCHHAPGGLAPLSGVALDAHGGLPEHGEEVALPPPAVVALDDRGLRRQHPPPPLLQRFKRAQPEVHLRVTRHCVRALRHVVDG